MLRGQDRLEMQDSAASDDTQRLESVSKDKLWGEYGTIQSDDNMGLGDVRAGSRVSMHLSSTEKATKWWGQHAGVVLFSTCVVLLVVFYAAMLYGITMEGIGIQEFMMPVLMAMPVALLVFCLLHSMMVLGWKLALIFFALVVFLSWVIEELGVLTGIIFGSYQYSDLISMHVFSVPLSVPFSWFIVLYLSFCVSDLIIEGQAHYRRPQHAVLNLVTLSACTGFIMTGWDMSADPLGSTASSVWIYDNTPGFYFGVPLLAFIGWFWTSSVVIAIYLAIEYYFPSKHLQKIVSTPVAALPLIAYFGLLLFYGTMSQPNELCVIAVFTMGFPLLLATTRLVHSALRTGTVDIDAYEP